jgi:alkanesulfonate monooxygenase SsuD/methylene tetrahydromethanopterin reductase-like flavin-dependent oxidoreductase (luciferase family)
VPVARQVASLADFAPGRLEFGVGIGGEDPAEYRMCGVDPSSRGARADEALAVLRPLLAGESVTFTGAHFAVADVAFRPAPADPVPLLVGGRSDAALRRAARFGDGWIGVWTSPERFGAATARIAELAAAQGRATTGWRHALHLWCGIGADRESATRRLAAEMEALYALPFERFARYCPAGRPEDVAEALVPFLEVGCRDVNLIAVGEDAESALEGALAVQALLRR